MLLNWPCNTHPAWQEGSALWEAAPRCSRGSVEHRVLPGVQAVCWLPKSWSLLELWAPAWLLQPRARHLSPQRVGIYGTLLVSASPLSYLGVWNAVNPSQSAQLPTCAARKHRLKCHRLQSGSQVLKIEVVMWPVWKCPGLFFCIQILTVFPSFSAFII